MERSEIIKELEEQYNQIPAHKMEIFKEFLLIINLKNISGNSIREDKMEEIITNYSGAGTLYNWTGLKENIFSYLHAHPEEKHFNYAMDIVKYTRLGKALDEFKYKKLLLLLSTKTGVQLEDINTVALFLSYHLFTQDGFIYNTCYNTTRDLLRFFATFFAPPSDLSKYYILDRMLSGKYHHNSNCLTYLKEDLVPEMMTEEQFFSEFLLLNNISFEASLQQYIT